MVLRVYSTVSVAVFVFCIAFCGCSWLHGACDAAMPSIAKAEALGTEAATEIDQAEAYSARLALPADIKAQFADAVAKARNVVAVGQATLTTFADACTSPDPTVIFGDLVSVWAQIETLLTAGQKATALQSGVSPVRAPAVVLLIRKRLVTAR